MPHNLCQITLPSFNFGNQGVCTYCGAPSKGRDHVIPMVFQRTSREHWDKDYEGPLTWACSSCNSRLGPKWFDTFDERARFVRDRIASQCKPVLWANWELKPLDLPLREFIRRDRDRRVVKLARSDWYESRDYWLNIENLQWHLEGQPNHPGSQFLKEYFRTTVAFIKEALYGVEMA